MCWWCWWCWWCWSWWEKTYGGKMLGNHWLLPTTVHCTHFTLDFFFQFFFHFWKIIGVLTLGGTNTLIWSNTLQQFALGLSHCKCTGSAAVKVASGACTDSTVLAMLLPILAILLASPVKLDICFSRLWYCYSACQRGRRGEEDERAKGAKRMKSWPTQNWVFRMPKILTLWIIPGSCQHVRSLIWFIAEKRTMSSIIWWWWIRSHRQRKRQNTRSPKKNALMYTLEA